MGPSRHFTVAVHQPQYLPWIGYFDKMDRADLFVLLDDAQFKKNEWQNRNRIKTDAGPQWLTVPVLHRFPEPIREVRVNPSQNWTQKHEKSLALHYRKSPFFGEYRECFGEAFSRKWEYLLEVNLYWIHRLAQILKISTPLLCSSELGVEGRGTERLIAMCKAVGATCYLSGDGAHHYLDATRFEEEGIQVEFQNFVHPEYTQAYGPFQKNLSALDLVLNVGGERSLALIRGMRKVP